MSCIIVAGVYRSGSSAVAGTLNNLGVYMGKNFDTPTKHNISGYWEDLEFKEFHSCLHTLEFKKQKPYMYLIESRRNLKLWGVKDPNLKNCLTHFYSTLDKMSIDHKLVICEREEGSIVKSLSKVLDKTTELIKIRQLVQVYLKELMFHVENYPGEKLYIRHEDLVSSPEIEIKKLCNFVGVEYKKECLDFIRNQ